MRKRERIGNRATVRSRGLEKTRQRNAEIAPPVNHKRDANSMQGFASQRQAIPAPINPQPESPNARSSAPKTP